jgi:hypothetical protein
MVDAVTMGGSRPLDERQQAARAQPELLEWLQTGRLTLLDAERQPVDVERWWSFPTETRLQALDEFQRVVRGNAKAAVLFLK